MTTELAMLALSLLLWLSLVLVAFFGWRTEKILLRAITNQSSLLEELSGSIAALPKHFRQVPTKRTAVVVLSARRSPSPDGKDLGRELEGTMVELLPGGNLTVQIMPQFDLEAGGTLSIDAPGFYMRTASVGQRVVGNWTRSIFDLPEMKLGVVVTVAVYRVEDP